MVCNLEEAHAICDGDSWWATMEIQRTCIRAGGYLWIGVSLLMVPKPFLFMEPGYYHDWAVSVDKYVL